MRLVVLLVIVACAGSQAPRRVVEPQQPAPRGLAEVPRPFITLPPLDLGRLLPSDVDPRDLVWPLTRHPAPEPATDPAVMFRSTGPWRSLCTVRKDPVGVDRDEALAYLMAWCAHERDPERSLLQLLQLVRARSYRIAKAVHTDVVALLATNSRSADAALALLGTYRIHMHDALAAAYQAVGRDRDATTVVTALRGHRPAALPADRCRRLLRDHLVTGRDVEDELRAFEADPVCARVLAPMQHRKPSRCVLETKQWPADLCAKPKCVAIQDHVIVTCRLGNRPWNAIALAAAYQTWPAGEDKAAIWVEYARFASDAVGLPGAVDLVAAALENALLVADCTTELPAIVALARTIHSRARYHRVLAHVASSTPATCATRASLTLRRRLRSGHTRN